MEAAKDATDYALDIQLFERIVEKGEYLKINFLRRVKNLYKK